MSALDAGMTKLSHALRTLVERWETTEEYWKDKVRVEFEERHLGPLQEQCRATLDAMQRVEEVLRRAESECR